MVIAYVLAETLISFSSNLDAAECLSKKMVDQHGRDSRQVPVAFWLLGLLNNTPYVIMLAAAKSISQGGTALVFIANIVPSLVLKLSAPYWFDRVSYRSRMVTASILMALSFSLIAVFSDDDQHKDSDASNATTSNNQLRVMMQLCGVAMISAQCGLGEASLLALGGKHDSARSGKNHCLTSFSSGTGIAGVFGFFWKVLLVNWIGLSLKLTMWLANILAVAYATIYIQFLWNENNVVAPSYSQVDSEDTGVQSGTTYPTTTELESFEKEDDDDEEEEEAGDFEVHDGNASTVHEVVPIKEMTTYQRFRLVLGLYPYMIPLCVVYAAEYSLQSGTWTAIGFPVTSLKARNQFYQYSNWMVSKCWAPIRALFSSVCSRKKCLLCLAVSDWCVSVTIVGDVVHSSHVAVVVDAGSAVCQCRLFLVGCSRPRHTVQQLVVAASVLRGSVGWCRVHSRLHSHLCRPSDGTQRVFSQRNKCGRRLGHSGGGCRGLVHPGLSLSHPFHSWSRRFLSGTMMSFIKCTNNHSESVGLCSPWPKNNMVCAAMAVFRLPSGLWDF